MMHEQLKEQRIRHHLREHRQVLDDLERQLGSRIVAAAELLTGALRGGGKIMIMGNGGSAADAQHFAAELVGRFLRDREPLPALALTTDSSVLTAVANDAGFENVFCRQIMALARPGDVAIGISTSGRSQNVLRGLEAANRQDCRTLALLGGDGGEIAGAVELALTVSSAATPVIQEAHLTIIHLLCMLIEGFLGEDPETDA